MALRDPVVIFTAASNARAEVICQALRQSGVEAYATEDLSMVGPLPGIHQPDVWVDRQEAEQAASLLRDLERREAELREGQPAGPNARELTATCEECGRLVRFPASQQGSVQVCPACGAFIDVPDERFTQWPTGGGAEADDRFTT